MLLLNQWSWAQPTASPAHVEAIGTYTPVVDTIGWCSVLLLSADTTGNTPAVGDTTFYYWDFGNGNYDTLYYTGLGAHNGVINGGHIFRSTTFYPSPGCFTAQLLVTNAMGSDLSTFTVCYADPQVSSVFADVSCYGMNDGSIDITVTGQGAPPIYSWPHDGSTTEDQTGLAPGTYTVTIDFTGCDTTLSWQIKEPAQVLAPSAEKDTLYCVGDLIAMMTCTGSGGTYTWYTNQGLTNVHATGSSVNPNGTVGSITYYVTETVNGCEGSADSVTITIGPKPNPPTAGTDNTYCMGQVMLAMNATGTGGTISWYSNPSATVLIDTGASIFPSGVLGTTTYYVTETVGFCKSLPATVTITVLPVINPTILAPPTFCETDPAADLQASDPGGIWSGLGITDSINGTFDPSTLSQGGYTVTHSSPGGCGGADSVVVVVLESPLLTATMEGETCLGTLDGSIDLVVTGGSTPYTYSWSDGSTSEDISGVPRGNYTVMVTDSNGCVATQVFTVPGLTTADCGYHVWVANAFSPNSDGENDYLYVRGKGIATVELRVFDRWGQQVFYTNDMAWGWDGTFKGEPVGTGVLFYAVEGTYASGEAFKDGGSVTLVR